MQDGEKFHEKEITIQFNFFDILNYKITRQKMMDINNYRKKF